MLSLLSLLFLISSSQSLYDNTENVINLTPSNFDKLVLQNDGIWLVEFYAPWCHHCKQLADAFKKVGKVLRGIINVGALDVDQYKDFGEEYDIRGFPTILIFGLKKKPSSYNGPRTLQDMVDEVLKVATKKIQKRIEKIEGKKVKTDVVELTEKNFDSLVVKSNDMWLVEFYAPWCGHCKNLAPEWEKAATLLKGKVKLGALDCTVHTSKAKEYSISGYPTIKVFPLGEKSHKYPELYEGYRTAEEIVNFALNKLQEEQTPPEIKELTNESILNECLEKMLCVISILPHILDCQSSYRNDYLLTLKTMGENFKRNAWGWIWMEAGSQLELEEALNIGGFGYPALVALNKSKMKYILMKGSFSTNGIKEFLRELSAGKVLSTYSLDKGIPNIKEVEGWNGKDGEYPKDYDVEGIEDIENIQKEEDKVKNEL